jgi:hypothetical protein
LFSGAPSPTFTPGRASAGKRSPRGDVFDPAPGHTQEHFAWGNAASNRQPGSFCHAVKRS